MIYKWYQDFQMMIASGMGILLQILYMENTKTWRAVAVIIVSSIAVSLYVALPAIDYFHIKNVKIQATIYATTAGFSVTLIRILIKILPPLFKIKFSNMMGINYEMLKKEEEEYLKNEEERRTIK